MFCSKARKKIREFLNSVNKEVFKHAEIALQITTNLKKFLDSNLTNIITAIIPGNTDDVIVAHTKIALEDAINTLLIYDELNKALSLEEKIKLIAEYIKSLKPQQKEATLIKLASLITAHLNNGEHKLHVYDSVVQMQYSLSKD